ncbi:MAG: hypothetical protein JF571_05360 [Asticcacaulis sp.]|nr:hypothetical protein [Asticcacaulis sp.]
MFGWFGKRTKEKEVPPLTPSTERSLVTDMHQMLTIHGLEARIENEWTFANNDFPLLAATRYTNKADETSATVRIDFVLLLKDDRRIVESYAGWGEDVRQAEGQGLYKFCVGAMHVFLSAFWDHHEPDQVDIEHWSVGGSAWNAYLSSLINNTSMDQKAGLPTDYMVGLQQAISHMIHRPRHGLAAGRRLLQPAAIHPAAPG